MNDHFMSNPVEEFIELIGFVHLKMKILPPLTDACVVLNLYKYFHLQNTN